MVVFMGLIKDLFPDVFDAMPRARDAAFEKLVAEVAVENNMRFPQPADYFVQNVVDLQDLLDIRHCVFLIGTSGNNKSQAWKTLANAWTKGGVHGQDQLPDINPKSITPNELYGYINLATREWKDGLLSSTMRDLANAADSKGPEVDHPRRRPRRQLDREHELGDGRQPPAHARRRTSASGCCRT